MCQSQGNAIILLILKLSLRQYIPRVGKMQILSKKKLIQTSLSGDSLRREMKCFRNLWGSRIQNISMQKMSKKFLRGKTQ